MRKRVIVGAAALFCLRAAGGGWADFSNWKDEKAYRPVSGVEGVSGALPAGWSDGSSWSGAKVAYGFKKEGGAGFLSVSAAGEGMCQFSNPSVPKLDTLGYFLFKVRGRSASGSDVIFGIRDTENDHAYSVMVKVPMTEEWKDYEVPVSGGPAAPQSAFFVELFSPGSADLAGFRLETVPKSLYVPDTAKAVAREDEGWLARHRELCARAAKAQPKVVILGDSITQRWEQNGREAWSQSVAPLQAANFGIDGDGTEHLLWRIRNSGLGQAFQPKLAVLLIGVNNIGAGCMPNDVALGAAACVSAVRQQSPGTRVLLLGVFPMAQSGDDGVRKTIREVNAGYAALADGRQVFFSDIGGAFLEKDASIAPAVMDDFLHLTPKGYGIYAKEIAPVLRKLLAN